MRATITSCAVVLAAAAPARAQLVEPGVTVLHTLHGESAGEQFGWAIADLPDLDGDGVAELAVGAPSSGDPANPAGRLDVFSGQGGSRLFRFAGGAGERMGWAMGDAGDIDGDGWPDILAGATGGGPGHTYIYSGRDGTLIDAVAGELAGDFFGFAVAGLGDVDGDGRDDFAVGAARASARAFRAGSVYVFSGRDRSLLRRHDGERALDFFGSGVAATGDLDGDGRGDYLVGARNAGDGQAGRAFLFSGATGLPIFAPLAPAPSGVDFGFFFVAAAGDVDGDGTTDLYVGDPSDAGNGPGSGRAYVFSGRGGRELREFPGNAGDGAGCGRGARDVDGDGRADIISGAYTSADGGAFAGKATVYSGCSGAPLRTFTSAQPGITFGYDAVGVGDVNDDGEADFAVGAATGDLVYVLAGDRTCVADFDRDGAVTRRDAVAFLVAVLLHDPRADSNCDGRVDGRDTLRFVLATLFGCG